MAACPICALRSFPAYYAAMGTTVNNVHVRIESADGQQLIADLVRQPSLVSPPKGGWISVFPADIGTCEALARSLSSGSKTVAIGFECFDSDFAAASLFSDGNFVGRLVMALSSVYEEIEGRTPEGEALLGSSGRIDVFGPLVGWIETLGTGSVAQVIEAVNKSPESPFVEHFAHSVLRGFGLDPKRLFMAHRFYEKGEHPEDRSTFVET